MREPKERQGGEIEKKELLLACDFLGFGLN
jgi:hypothetical protein